MPPETESRHGLELPLMAVAAGGALLLFRVKERLAVTAA
jgi:hypothetical protein